MEDRVIRRIGDEILSPVFVEFIKWMLKSAGEQKIRRIYFFARDGYLMYLAAKILARGRRPEIECRYLRCSRYAFRTAAFWTMGEEALSYICGDGTDVSLRSILRRGGFSGAEIQETAGEIGWEGRLRKPLNKKELEGLKRELGKADGFWRRLRIHSEKAYQAAAGYLLQEGMLDGTKWAAADSGWVGSMQKILGELLRTMGYKGKVRGYYFGLYEIPEEEEFLEYHAYYFPPVGKIRRKVWFSNSLFECLIQEPSPMTVGYRREGERFVPVFEKEPEAGAESGMGETPGTKGRKKGEAARRKIGGRILRRAAAEERTLPEELKDWRIQGPEKFEKKLGRFMGSPGEAEAGIFGTLPFSDDVLKDGGSLAAPAGEREIRRNGLFYRALAELGFFKEPPPKSAWMEGSIRLSGRRVRRALWQNRIYKYALYARKSAAQRRKHKKAGKGKIWRRA